MKKIYIALILIMITIIPSLIFLKSSTKINNYQKYRTDISIKTFKNKQTDLISILVNDDGSNAIIKTNLNNYDTYIKNNSLYYIDEFTIYTYDLKTSYREIYNIVKSIKKKDVIRRANNTTYYSAVMKKDQLNKLLDAMFFHHKNELDAIAKFSVKDKLIETFNLTLSNVDGYEKIEINISFEALNDDFKIDISKLSGVHQSLVIATEIKDAEENILEIIK